MKVNLLIFDLDGTLYKTENVSVPALKEAFSEFDIILSENTILKQFGEPTSKIIDNLVPPEKKDKQKKIRKRIIKKEDEMIPEKATLYEGTKRTLDTLKERGYNLTICSNGRYDYIDRVLQNTSIKDYFSTIRGYNAGKNKSDHIKELMEEFSVNEAVMIGDRYHDVKAANKAGIISIGALYGYGNKEAKKADYIIKEPSELISILDEEIY